RATRSSPRRSARCALPGAGSRAGSRTRSRGPRWRWWIGCGRTWLAVLRQRKTCDGKRACWEDAVDRLPRRTAETAPDPTTPRTGPPTLPGGSPPQARRVADPEAPSPVAQAASLPCGRAWERMSGDLFDGRLLVGLDGYLRRRRSRFGGRWARNVDRDDLAAGHQFQVALFGEHLGGVA